MNGSTEIYSYDIVMGIIERYNLSSEAKNVLLESMNSLIQAAIITDFCTDKRYEWDMTKYQFNIKRKKPYRYKSPEYRKTRRRIQD